MAATSEYSALSAVRIGTSDKFMVKIRETRTDDESFLVDWLCPVHETDTWDNYKNLFKDTINTDRISESSDASIEEAHLNAIDLVNFEDFLNS